MSPHFLLMLVMAGIWWLDSFVWLWQDHPADAGTFLFFGIGYVFLGIAFRGIT